MLVMNSRLAKPVVLQSDINPHLYNRNKKLTNKKVNVPSGQPIGRIACPSCGNDRNFIEVARDVIVTTSYVQNMDGSFTPEDNDTEIVGKVGLFCGQCNADLSAFINHLQEMTF